MSEFKITVVKLGPMIPHPNADTLNITKVFDYQVITKKDGFKEGDLVVYIPVDSVVPDTEEWHFLCPLDDNKQPRFPVGQVPEKYRVIEAKKLRGVFSQGMLAPLPERKSFNVTDDSLDAPDGATIFTESPDCPFKTWYHRSCDEWVPVPFKEGDAVGDIMGITKYESPMPATTGGEVEAPPKGWVFPIYTDIEGMRRYPNIIQEGEEVVLTEKLHGANARFVHDGRRLWVGSHGQIKKLDPERPNIWWQLVPSEINEKMLEDFPFHVFFGEVYGQVQDLRYGIKSGVRFRVFDVYDVKGQKYLDHDDAVSMATMCDLEWVPTLYRGQWKESLKELCEGTSTLAENVREGFVVKPVKERWDPQIGRVVLKMHGQGYLLRKKK